MLLPDSKAELVLRPPRKAVLRERGLVLSELMINKGWSEQEVIEYLEGCFQEKLQDLLSFSMSFR